ncbi:MAG: TIGR00304 family membrane protein [Candidatus Bathyarchaeaceae archaeon]
MGDQLLFSIGIILLFAGFAIAFVAVILLAITAVKEKGKVRGGGAVIIGPFPIIFGTDKEAVKILLLLSIALITLILVVMAFSYYAFK